MYIKKKSVGSHVMKGQKYHNASGSSSHVNMAFTLSRNAEKYSTISQQKVDQWCYK